MTIVWSGYRSPTSHNVYLRTIRCNGMAISPDDTTANVPVQKSRGVEWVWRYNGLNDTLWGTPVVSRLDGGEMIAWSDSTQGIIAMFRRMGHGTNWWQPFGAGVKYLAPTAVDASPLTGAEIYPSMPAEGHVAGLDSTIGIVWQHILPGSQGSRIEYARIAHVAPFGANNILSYSQMFLNQGGDRDNRHPSIDATQDVWGGVQEGVTWESFETNPQDGRNMVDTWVHFTSLNTAYHDVTHQWTYNKAYINYPTGQFSGRPYFYYPNIASLNARSDVAHQHDSIYFALLMSPVGINPMRQAIMLYAAHGWRNFPANKYLYEPYLLGGPHANGSASPTRQPVRYAALYETTKGDSMALTTTRQFFAKSRPTGYAARGRQATFRISDSLNTGITARLHDVWYAGNDSAGAADMTARTDSNATTDTLSQVRALMRTGYFHAHDSTTIGCDLREMFYGDSAYADSTHIDFIVEVIDSATELAVGRLDSFRIASTTWLNDTVIMRTFDLLSGTYYVRMRIEPTNLPDSPSVHDSRYPVEDVASWVNDPPPLAKLRRMEGEAGASGRLSVWPNPARGHAEITFSVPARSRVSLSVYDISGGEVLRVVEPGAMEAGRYAVDIDGGHLAPGTYLVRMAYGERQLAEKLVIVR